MHEAQHQQYPASQYQSNTAGEEGSQNFSKQLQEKVKGIVNLCEGGSTKKQNKLLEFSKKCPVGWAKKVTLESINLPLFTYGAITELEAALSGRSEPLPQGELLAKICHLKNTMEICCVNSDPKDFSSYGWTLAKNYAFKVDENVSQGLTTWVDMSPGVQTNNLVLAQMECPRPTIQKNPQTQATNVIKAKDRCTTYNKCETEGTCEYEKSNPGTTCKFKHECSWCRKNLGQGFRHQELKCNKKLENAK